MDDLTSFILQELAFEGDLGSDVARLRELISQYYTTYHPELCQNIDDRLCAFVWSILATQQDVVVGLAPTGAVTVYFPPQVSASRKGKEKAPGDIATTLSPLAFSEVASTPLDSLIKKHGNGLRIAVTPETCFKRITGSHIRPPKLSGPVYAVLQLITRTRREGTSVIDISRQSGYDPKTCFYLVRTLVELGHIYKIKVGGAAGNICIHRVFYDDECEWKKAEKEAMHEGQQGDDSRPVSPAASDASDDEGKELKGVIQFNRIDNRHLSNLGLIKSRLEKLLRHAPHGIHVYRNLLFAIGFDATSKKERRIFTHRMHELIKFRFIEKVWAPSDSSSTGRVLCVRLVIGSPTASTSNVDIAELGAGDDPKEDEALVDDMPSTSMEDLEYSENAAQELLAQFEGTFTTQSIAHQVVSLVEQSGPRGMTISEISRQIHNFDHRSVTNLISRFASGAPPSHLADRGLTIATEIYGRERRQRIYTHAGYRSMIDREGLQDTSAVASADDLARAGGWAVFEVNEFVVDEEARRDWMQEHVRAALVSGGEKAIEKARNKKKRTNPLDADGKPIIGRPRKEWVNGKSNEKGPPKKRGRPPKRKAEEMESATEPPVAPKRGRPPKMKPDPAAIVEAKPADASDAQNTADIIPGVESPAKPATRQRTKRISIPNNTSQQTGPALEGQLSSTNEVISVISVSCLEQPADCNKSPGKGMRTLRKPKGAVDPKTSVAHDAQSDPAESCAAPSPTRPRKRARIEPGLEYTGHKTSVTATAQPPHPATEQATPSLDELTRIEPEFHEPPALHQISGQTDAVPVSTGDAADILQVQHSPTQTEGRQGRPTNVSTLRRQTEFLQVLETMGGVANISIHKLFSDEHQRLLETLQAAGKPISTAPGTGMDRRTFSSTISALESRGLVKTRVVSTITSLGAIRRATILHLPNAPENSIEACVAKFRESTSSTKGAPIANDYPSLPGAVSAPKAIRASANVPPHDPPVPPAAEPPEDPLSAARLTHLADSMTAAQFVGYVLGRFSRARVLHLRLLSEIMRETTPSTVVSPQEKVISKDYFFSSIPVATYCAIIPLGTVIPGLRELLDTKDGQEIRLCDTPENIQSGLRPRSSANRSRMHKTLSTLVGIGCLVPVQPVLDSTSQVHYVAATSEDEHWNYFKLANSVPIYQFADKENNAPFCHNHEVFDGNTGISLWQKLRAASHPSTCFTIESSGLYESHYSGDQKLLRAIRRTGAWESEYVLSTAQVEYLNGLVDTITGLTPLDDQQSTRFDNACFVTTVPVSAASTFFKRAREDIQRGLERIRVKSQKQANDRRRLEEEARYALARKAEKAKQDQDARWESIVTTSLDGQLLSHPQLQKALSALKSAYMLAPQPTNSMSWEKNIQEVARDTLGAKQFVIAPTQAQEKTPTSQHEPETGISALILRQGHQIVQKGTSPKRPGRKPRKQPIADVEEVPQTTSASDADLRRRRFPWTPEYDELARDAGAIIRVRCHGQRMDWSALEQIFPGVQRNSVRQRITALEAFPGAATYFRRLDKAWAKLWVQHRGSEALPDPHPESMRDFDLAAHIVFLRRHIDKVALRAGSDVAQEDTTKSSFILESIEELHANYVVNDKPLGLHPQQPTTWDFCFDTSSEEPREREFLQHSFVWTHRPSSNETTPVKIAVAQAAIKMVMSTPDNSYDSGIAGRLLSSLGKNTIETAIEGMNDSLDLKRLRVDKQEPGRKYTYSDLELLRLKGDFANSMYPDAVSMRENLDNLQSREWMNIDLTDEDGEAAAYLQLISDDKLHISIDTAIPKAGREHIGWQSKKVDDENLETQLSIRLKPKSAYSAPVLDKIPACEPDNLLPRCIETCQHAPGRAGCDGCLSAGENRLSDPNHLALMRSLREAGPLGLSVPQMLDLLNVDSRTLLSVVSELTQATPPLAYVLGYDQARIVSVFHLHEWTVQVTPPTTQKQAQPTLVFPRRWLDIHGNMIESFWKMALRTVVGAFIYRPTMSEHTLRARYKGIFDRQELNEILKYLLSSGRMKRISSSKFPLGMVTLEDEDVTYWSLSSGFPWF